MSEVVLCRTKAGKGFKIVVDGTWYYSSIGEVFRMIKGGANAATFRTIEDDPLPPDVPYSAEPGGVLGARV